MIGTFLFLELVAGYSGRAIKMFYSVTFYWSSLWGLRHLACLAKLSPHLTCLERGIWSVRLGTQRQEDYVTLSLFSRNKPLLFNNLTSKPKLWPWESSFYLEQITVTQHLLTFFAFCRLLIVYTLKAEFGQSKYNSYLNTNFCLTVGSSQWWSLG